MKYINVNLIVINFFGNDLFRKPQRKRVYPEMTKPGHSAKLFLLKASGTQMQERIFITHHLSFKLIYQRMVTQKLIESLENKTLQMRRKTFMSLRFDSLKLCLY